MGNLDIKYAQFVYEGLLDVFQYKNDGSFKTNITSLASESIDYLVKDVKTSFDEGRFKSVLGLVGTLDDDVAFRSSQLTCPGHVEFSSQAKSYSEVSDSIIGEYLLNNRLPFREKNIVALEIYNNHYRPHPVINIGIVVPFFYVNHSAAAIIKELKGGDKVCYTVLKGGRYARLMNFSNSRLNDIGSREIINLKQMLKALRPMIQSNVFASSF